MRKENVRNNCKRRAVDVGMTSAMSILALFSVSSSVHADAFASANQKPITVSDTTNARIEKLEQELTALREQTRILSSKKGGPPTPAGLEDGPGNLMLPEPPPGSMMSPPNQPKPIEDYDLSYVKLGEVGGKLIVKLGTRRLLLTEAEFASLKQREEGKSAMLASTATNKPGSPPVPPAATPSTPPAVPAK